MSLSDHGTSHQRLTILFSGISINSSLTCSTRCKLLSRSFLGPISMLPNQMVLPVVPSSPLLLIVRVLCHPLIAGDLLLSHLTAFHNRSSVRDFLVNTRSSTSKLQTKLDTLATKILLCKSSTASNANVVAYGVSVASGASLLPVARKFGGKRSLSLTSVTAKYEVIVATGVYQTPQLLQVGFSV